MRFLVLGGLAILAACTVAPPPVTNAARQPPARPRALVVGVGEVAPDAGASEASSIAEALGDRVNARLLLGPKATSGAILRATTRILAAAGPDEDVVLVFATRGVRSGRDVFLYAADTEPGERLPATGVPVRTLREAILASRARSVVALVHLGPARAEPGPALAPLLSALAARDGVTVQVVRAPAGVYAPRLAEALAGRADLDRDGAVRLDELAVTLHAALPGLTTFGHPSTLAFPVTAPGHAPASVPPIVEVCVAREGAAVPLDARFRTGDQLELSVRPAADGHLRVTGVGLDGSPRVLSPPDDRVSRGSTVQAPPAAGLPVFLLAPAGAEPIEITFSRIPFDAPSRRSVRPLVGGVAPPHPSTALRALPSPGPCARWAVDGDGATWTLDLTLDHQNESNPPPAPTDTITP